MKEKFKPAIETEASKETQKVETGKREATRFFEKLDKKILVDYLLLKDKKLDYERAMEDIFNIHQEVEEGTIKLGKERMMTEKEEKLQEEIRKNWVSEARKALTEWIDAETNFVKKYGSEMKNKIQSEEEKELYSGKSEKETQELKLEREKQESNMDTMAILYEVTEYSPEERKLAKEGKL